MPCLAKGTYRSSTASSATGTTTAAATATARSSATGTLGTRVAVGGTLGLLTSGLRSASKLDRDLALENVLAGKLSDGTLSLSRGRKVDEGIADRAVGAGVLRNGDGLPRKIEGQSRLSSSYS